MIKNFKYKKSLTLLCIYLISMIVYSFYIQNNIALILIEVLLFLSLISCINSIKSCINSIKCNFLYRKFIRESLNILDSVQEKSNNENIVYDNPVELKRDVCVISNKTGIDNYEKSNKLGKQCKKKKKI